MVQLVQMNPHLMPCGGHFSGIQRKAFLRGTCRKDRHHLFQTLSADLMDTCPTLTASGKVKTPHCTIQFKFRAGHSTDVIAMDFALSCHSFVRQHTLEPLLILDRCFEA